MKSVVYTPDALRQIRKLGRDVAKRVQAKVASHASGGSADVTSLQGEADAFRLRVGDWRVIFIETSAQITVLRIGPRRDVYD